MVNPLLENMFSRLLEQIQDICRNKKLLGAPGLTTRNKDATRGEITQSKGRVPGRDGTYSTTSTGQASLRLPFLPRCAVETPARSWRW